MAFKLKISHRLLWHSLLVGVYIVVVCVLLKMTVGQRKVPSGATQIEYRQIALPVQPDQQKMAEIKKSLVPTTRETLVAEEKPAPEPVGNPLLDDRYDPLEKLSSSTISTNDTMSGMVKLPSGTGNNYYGGFSSRSETGRKNGLRHGGGSDTEAAVIKALNYLRQRQNPDGSWGEAGSENQVALTGLAMLAFLGHGETPDSQEYGKVVQRGMQKMIFFANMQGIEKGGRGFGHAILTYALAEAAGMVASGELTAAMNKRVEFLIKRQNKFGGFYYDYDNNPVPADKEIGSGMLKKGIVPGEPRCDLSFSGWNIQALKAAWTTGAEVSGLYEALMKSKDALTDIHQGKEGGFSFGINGGKYEADPEVTPVGIYCLQILGDNSGKNVVHALKWLRQHRDGLQFIPMWNSNQRFPLYVWYYQSLMLHQYRNGTGALWQNWNRNLKKMLLPRQQNDGAWQLPRKGGNDEIIFKHDEDYAVYCTAFCTMILEVYYRYGQSGKLEKNCDNRQNLFADISIPGLDLLLARNRAALLKNSSLKNLVVDVALELFKAGEFNGKPSEPSQALEQSEFVVYQSNANTIQVHSVKEFPQRLMPSQRIAVYLDNLPKSIYGGLRLKAAIGSKEFKPPLPPPTKRKKNRPVPVKSNSEISSVPRYRALQILWNQKNLRQQTLVVNQQYLELLIPNDQIEKGGNILELRNTGTEPICFDFLSISSDQAKPEMSLAFSAPNIPPPENMLTANQFTTFKEPLSSSGQRVGSDMRKLSSIPGSWNYLDVFQRGSSQQVHYFYQIPRDIIEWYWSGGQKIIFGSKTSSPGEILFDDFGKPKLSWYGLDRIMPLFDGTPQKVICNVLPSDPAMIPYDLFWTASQNGPDTITIQIVSYRFRFAELEVTCPVPWSGATEMKITKGATVPSAFLTTEAAGIPKWESDNKIVEIKQNAVLTSKINNVTQECGIFRSNITHSVFTTIRLHKRGGSTVAKASKLQLPEAAQVNFDSQSPKVSFQDIGNQLLRTGLRVSGNHGTATESDCYRVGTIPATKGNVAVASLVVPWDRQSDQITIQFPKDKKASQHGARLFFGEAPTNADVLAFWIYPRLTETWRTAIKLKFQLSTGTGKKYYEVMLKVNRWQQVAIPLVEPVSLAWGSICFFGDPESPEYSMKVPVSFEFNGWAQYAKVAASPIIDGRIEARKNYVAITLFGKPGSTAQFRSRLAVPALFQTPIISINQFDRQLNAPDKPTGNLSYNCPKTKTKIKFDQDSQIVQVDARFPLKTDLEWLKNSNSFNNAEKAKIIKGELMPMMIVIKSDIKMEDLSLKKLSARNGPSR